MLLTLSALALLAADIDPEPPAAAPVVRFRAASSRNGHTSLTFEVRNPGPVPIPYVGYGDGPNKDGDLISPLYGIQEQRKNAWKDGRIGWCGTGVGDVSLPPRGKVSFTVHVPEGDWEQLRVGLRWRKPRDKGRGTQTAWSDPVGRKAAGLQ